MNIVIVGGGPAGLYCGLLIKKAHPGYDVTILERNAADVTYGWGVVFSDRTLAAFQRADYKTYEQITDHFVIWDAIDVHYREETIRCGGHIIASIARKRLLHALQRRCAELGVELQFGRELTDVGELGQFDLLIAADGINSVIRRTYGAIFKPSIELGKAHYIWLGVEKALDAFTFIFRENEHGHFQVHAYPSSGATSTFIVECDDASWRRAGMDQADEAQTLAYCERLFARDLGGARLLSNNSKWINFPTLTTKHWRHGRMVLLGDAAHSAHFSIGSGTKLAMEDAIALASALEQYADMETALNEYELERKPVVELFQRAASVSQGYFETVKRSMELPPMQFAFQLLTRSGRVSYDDLRLRDTRFADGVDRWFARGADGRRYAASRYPLVAPPPLFTPLGLRSMVVPNRVGLVVRSRCAAHDGLPTEDYLASMGKGAQAGAGILLTEVVAVAREGRMTPECLGLYDGKHVAVWKRIVEHVHASSAANVGLQLGHAGRRGSTRPRSEGLDRPLRQGQWALLAPSALAYTPQGQVPREMTRSDMERVRDDFVRAAGAACEVGFDLLQLNIAQGYLLAGFLSTLSNRREDEYGGRLENRLRFPLEVFDAVRGAWPADKPLAVALNASDYAKGGWTIEEAIEAAVALKGRGCDIIAVQAGQTTPDGEPPYGKGYVTPLSEQLRNEAGIATMVGGYLTSGNEVNTILAAGRADLCLLHFEGEG